MTAIDSYVSRRLQCIQLARSIVLALTDRPMASHPLGERVVHQRLLTALDCAVVPKASWMECTNKHQLRVQLYGVPK